jgi:glutamine synthetase
MGAELIDTFIALKGFEVERHQQWVSEWDLDEYLHHL